MAKTKEEVVKKEVNEEKEVVEEKKEVKEEKEAPEEVIGEDDPIWSDSGKIKNYIKDLRKENASYRTKAKESQLKVSELSERFNNFEMGMKQMLGISEGDKISPEERVQHLSQTVESLQFDSAINEIFIERGVTGGIKGKKYLSFLMQEAASELNEGEELTDAKLDEIVSQVQATFKSGSSQTSVNGSGIPPADEKNSTLTPEAFARMSLADKTTLYSKNKSQYDTLMAAAKDKRLI